MQERVKDVHDKLDESIEVYGYRQKRKKQEFTPCLRRRRQQHAVFDSSAFDMNLTSSMKYLGALYSPLGHNSYER